MLATGVRSVLGARPRDQLSPVAKANAARAFVIPARLQSTRLPDKPLADIAGEPMIVHVWRRAMAAEVGRVVVATDTERIIAAVRGAGGEAVMTRADHASGSDRVFEAVNHVDPEGDFETILNLQGDLPTLEPHLIRDCLGPCSTRAPTSPRWPPRSSDEEERTDPNVVKVVGTPTAAHRRLRALYFTRATAPAWRRAALSSYRHLRLPPLGAGALRIAAALAPGKARAARAIARAGRRHAHRRDAR